jgi:hypothetical protein
MADTKEDTGPVLQVVPIEDLDKIEKLLDVFLSTIEMPHLGAIRQACMDELMQINAAMSEAQVAAADKFAKESVEYEAKKRAEAKAKADAEAKEKADAQKANQAAAWQAPTQQNGVERRI